MYRPTGERERERERKKKDTKESGKAWTSLLALLMEGWCVWMKDKRKRVHPSSHPSGLLESSQMPIEIHFWEPPLLRPSSV
jgi:hypothetical protein